MYWDAIQNKKSSTRKEEEDKFSLHRTYLISLSPNDSYFQKKNNNTLLDHAQRKRTRSKIRQLRAGYCIRQMVLLEIVVVGLIDFISESDAVFQPNNNHSSRHILRRFIHKGEGKNTNCFALYGNTVAPLV